MYYHSAYLPSALHIPPCIWANLRSLVLGRYMVPWHNALVDIKNLVTYSGNLTNYINIESSLGYVSNDSYLPNTNGPCEVVCIVK